MFHQIVHVVFKHVEKQESNRKNENLYKEYLFSGITVWSDLFFYLNSLLVKRQIDNHSPGKYRYFNFFMSELYLLWSYAPLEKITNEIWRMPYVINRAC